ncbi:hypothetical protein SYNPS1DRAFT_26783 [Syncephalis pseudoplumigaleata]|uniref:CUE domain-containing protein n=1 Tax=Syncephalis pseudoplumigaleata TaxID=1712513 RepID=A0A4V1J273_9FUNG|nr:hypothetical protein SYNPS1DRAFT_26783 [Syncephalis pseudoplumigaleata]|eukprot:RKP27559.1 hypothetical protein SYNPS1DRAFT_26783 [Syncephalis pseudoplumigaleata]
MACMLLLLWLLLLLLRHAVTVAVVRVFAPVYCHATKHTPDTHTRSTTITAATAAAAIAVMTPSSQSSSLSSSSLAACPPFLSAKLWLSLERDQRLKACQCWQWHCKSLLNAPADLFWSLVLETPAVIRFLRTFIASFRFVLAEQEKEDMEERESMKRINSILLRVGHQVLLVLSRLTEPTEAADQQCAPHTAMDYLMQVGLFDAPGIFDMAATYGFSNTSMVLDLLNGVILLVPNFVDQFERLLEEIMEVFRRPTITSAFARHAADDPASSASKGKGIATATITTTIADNDNNDDGDGDGNQEDIDWLALLDLITAFDAFTNVMATGCFPLQIRCYSRWHGWLLIMDGLYSRMTKVSPVTRRCKYALLIIVWKLLEYRYFSNFHADDSDSGNVVTTPSYEGEICLQEGEQLARAATQCCDLLLALLDSANEATADCPLEACRFLETTPLLVDLEIEFSLSRRITRIRSSFEQCHEDRIDYVLLSLQHFREAFSTTRSLHELFARMAMSGKQPRSQMASANTNSKSINNYANASKTYYRHQHHGVDSASNSARDKLSVAIEQIQAILPELGQGFIVACLKCYQGNVEHVIAHLLEDDLSPELRAMDRQAPRAAMTAEEEEDELACIYGAAVEYSDGASEAPSASANASDNEDDDARPSSESLLATRRNIYDNDEFDLFARQSLDRERVYQGKKSMSSEFSGTAPLNETYKSRIIERAMASDEDEYDDTYDGLYEAGGEHASSGTFEDVDGSGQQQQPLSSAMATTSGKSSTAMRTADPTLVHEPTLIKLYISDPGLFNRSAASRKSAERARLRDTTGLSNEQIEGWASQLARDPKRYRDITAETEWTGQQTLLASTTPTVNARQQPPQQPSKRSHALKDRHKAQRANHSRKRGHARKMRDTLPQQ